MRIIANHKKMEEKGDNFSLKLLFVRIVRDIFFASAGLFLALSVLEDLKPGFVSHNLSLGSFLTVCLTSGIMTLLTSRISANSKRIDTNDNLL